MQDVDFNGWAALIVAITGLLGLGSAHILNRRGKRAEQIQTQAATSLAERAQGFDEMESIVEILKAELTRAREQGDLEALQQARRCRTTFDHFMRSFIDLIGQVGSESTRQAAERVLSEVEVHLAEDHPERPETPTA